MIREAVLGDVSDLVELGADFINGSKYKDHSPIDYERTTNTMIALVESDDGKVFVSDQDGRIVGMIGLLATLNIFSNEPTVTEMFWFVDPKFRGSGVRLLIHASV